MAKEMTAKYSQLLGSEQQQPQHQGHGPRLKLRPPQQEQQHFKEDEQNGGVSNVDETEETSPRMEENNVEIGGADDDDERANEQTTDEEESTSVMVSSDSESILSNTSLSLASNLERFALSDNIFNRQMVARSLLDTLKSVIQVEEDVNTVLSVLIRLSEDTEPTVRAELVDQVPHIASFCLEQTGNQKLLDVHSQYLLPLVVKHLADINNPVRKTCQTTILALVEQKLITNDQICENVYPALLHLSSADNLDHCRADAVALMSRMATLLGKEMAQKLFLDRFVIYCADALIQVRKMCAIHFGDMCAVMGEEITENVLLPLFADLCKDTMWGVRKACADVFVTVSCVCLMSTRRERLAQLFVLLLMDVSRWVRLAAFQALGAFISTFADPNNPFLYYDEEGNIHAATQDTTEEEDELTNTDSGFGSQVVSNVGSPLSDELDDIERQCPESNEWQIDFNSGAQLADVTARLTISEKDDYNCFQYWREPIGEVAIETNLSGEMRGRAPTVEKLQPFPKSKYSIFLNMEVGRDDHDEGYLYQNELGEMVHIGRREDSCYSNQRNYSTFAVDPLTYNPVSSNDSTGCHLTLEEFEAIAPNSLRDIVPAELLYHYVQMTNPVLLQSLDSEIVRYCAFSFPAVVLTLGRKHWPLIRNLYKKLASDMQWKVRRTLAFSIHELAAILGRELAASDLVPVFDSFIRDLDEVRIGILKHLSSFISSLPKAVRILYLEKVGEFLEPENERNWRFRLELTQQLSHLCPLYSDEDVAFHILPVAIRLLQDKVAEVRTATVKSLAVLVELLPCLTTAKKKTVVGKRMVSLVESRRSPDDFLISLAENLVNTFAHHRNWNRRQTFASCCLRMRKSYPRVLMSKHLLPSLLDLAKDPVANVRLVVAQVLKEISLDRSSTVVNWDQEVETNLKSEEKDDATTSESEDSEIVIAVNEAVERLQNDSDRDVRQAANWTVITSSDSVPCAITSTATTSSADDAGACVLQTLPLPSPV